MRPAPIPDSELWTGAKRVVFSAPDGDLTNDLIAPVEALLDVAPTTGVDVVSVRCVLEPGDLERLQAGGVVWVSFYGGGIMPFSVDVVGPPVSNGSAA